jgi:hypothetical protein
VKICYIDESGDTGTVPHANSPVQPVLVIAAVALDHTNLTALTHAFINLKQKFSPSLAGRNSHRFDVLLNEMKGTDIRRGVVSGRRRESRRAIGFLDRYVELLEFHRVRIFGRVWVKKLRYAMDGKAVFTSSVQAICRSFQEYLTGTNDSGIVIADSRTPGQNVPVAHSIFTQKFRVAGDPYHRIYEMPTFGHSNNHVGLQVADLLASALLFPIAAYAYCSGHVNNIHVNHKYQVLRDRYGQRLERLQFRHLNHDGRRCGGITVSDELGSKSGAHMFKDCAKLVAAAAATAAPPVLPVTSSTDESGPSVTITTPFDPPL